MEETGVSTVAAGLATESAESSSRTAIESAKQERDEAQKIVDELLGRLSDAKSRLADAETQYRQALGSVESPELKEPSQWNTMYKKLLDFRAEHGHCLVPHSTKGNKELTSLGRWVANQRVFYKMHQDGKQGHIKPIRIEALEKIGFIWNVNDMIWDNKLQELIKYKEENGTCDVPPKCSKEHKKLRNWIELQRQQYRLHRAKRTTSLSLERINKLENMGFEWRISDGAGDHSHSAKKKKRAIIDPTKDELEEWWNGNFEELKAYRQENGHCRMHQRAPVDSQRSRQGTSRLRDFASWQRKEWKRLQKGEPSDMTQDRIQKLEEIGFEFVTNPKKGGKLKIENSQADQDPANYAFTDDGLAQHVDDAAAAAASVVDEIEDSQSHAAV